MCPVKVPDQYNEGLGERKAIYKLYPQAIPNTYAVTKKGHSPCKRACAVHTSAQGYVALIADGRFAEAYTVASEPNPFAAVCGRVCTHKCETDCTRGEVEEPIAIAGLKRFVTDYAVDNVPLPEKAAVTFEEKVAIVGAGPSGLTAARDLALLGYQTTVFESKPEPGGMLRFGIPEYRLPKAALQQDIDRVLALGVDLQCGKAAGKDFTVDGLLRRGGGYKAVYLAVGLQGGRTLPIPGADAKGVLDAVSLLKAATLGEKVDMGKNVVVIGGGDVAFDAGRTALRLGAEKVTINCIEDDQSVPASDDELSEGLDESIAFNCSCMPSQIVTDAAGRACKVEFLACSLGDPDARGWRPPVAIAGTEHELDCDTVIFAIGQSMVDDFLEGSEGITVEKGQILTDKATLGTGKKGVFAGGDAAASAPWTAIEAVAAGQPRRAQHPQLPARRGAPPRGRRLDGRGQARRRRARQDRGHGAHADAAPAGRGAQGHLGRGQHGLLRGAGRRRGQALPRLRRSAPSAWSACAPAGPAPCCTASATRRWTSTSAPSCWPRASTCTTPAPRASTATSATPTCSRRSSTSAC